MNAEELNRARDLMLEEAIQHGEPSYLYGLLNRLAGQCNVCAMGRGFALGLLVSGVFVWWVL